MQRTIITGYTVYGNYSDIYRYQLHKKQAVYYNVTMRLVLSTIVAVQSNNYCIFCVCVCSVRYPVRNAHPLCYHLWPVRLYYIFPHYIINSGFGGLGVACWPLVPKFAGSNPAETVGFLGRKNPHTPSFGGEVKPSVPCRRFTACKRSLNLRGSWNLGKITGHISRPQFHLSLLGSLASLRTYRHLAAKVRTSKGGGKQ